MRPVSPTCVSDSALGRGRPLGFPLQRTRTLTGSHSTPLVAGVSVGRSGYALLVLLLLGLLLSRTTNQLWAGDFWEHAAVVRELATNPLQPRHPILPIEAPHAFYSPYALVLALLSRLAGLDAIAILSVAGLLNLALLLAGLYALVVRLGGSAATACLALLFTLLLWGEGPWPYSGFFHLAALGSVLPFPSTFAMALTLWGLSGAVALLRDGRMAWAPALAALSFCVLVAHPTTALFLFAGLGALGVGFFSRERARRYVALSAALTVALGLAFAWPYYPLAGLLLSPDPEFHRASRVFYEDVMARCWPALLALPIVALRLRADWRDPLGVLFVGLSAVYLAGGLLEKWGFGRLISNVVLVAHLCLALWLTSADRRLGFSRVDRLGRWVAAVPVALAMLLTLADLRPFLRESLPGRDSSYEEFTFLSRFVGQYEVVFSDERTSLLIPTFGGKVVSFPRPLHFVPDAAERRADVRLFYGERTSPEERARILQRHDADWLLINAAGSAVSSSAVPSFRRLGRVVYSDEKHKLTLVRIERPQ